MMLPHVDEFRPVHNLSSIEGLISALFVERIAAASPQPDSISSLKEAPHAQSRRRHSQSG